jgi:hypothetical protein
MKPEGELTDKLAARDDLQALAAPAARASGKPGAGVVVRQGQGFQAAAAGQGHQLPGLRVPSEAVEMGVQIDSGHGAPLACGCGAKRPHALS